MKKGKTREQQFPDLLGVEWTEIWKRIVDAIQNSVGIIDMDNRFIVYNKNTPHLLRTDDKTISSRRCHELMHHTDTPPENCPYERMKKSKQHESEIFQEEGRWLKVSVDPLFDRNGEVNGAVYVIQDISKRVETESKLESIRNRLTDTLESMSDCFVFLNNDWVYTYVNQNAAAMFNRNPEDLTGKHIRAVFPEEVGQTFYKNFYKAVETRKPIRFREHYQPWDRWFETRIIPSKRGIAIFFRDITKNIHAKNELFTYRHRLEDLVKRRTDELEKRNRELERLNTLFVDREFRIKELRERVKELESGNT